MRRVAVVPMFVLALVLALPAPGPAKEGITRLRVCGSSGVHGGDQLSGDQRFLERDHERRTGATGTGHGAVLLAPARAHEGLADDLAEVPVPTRGPHGPRPDRQHAGVEMAWPP